MKVLERGLDASAVRAAASRIDRHIRRTPTERSAPLSQLAHREVQWARRV